MSEEIIDEEFLERMEKTLEELDGVMVNDEDDEEDIDTDLAVSVVEDLEEHAPIYMEWVATLNEKDILGYFMNEEALEQGIARSDLMIFHEHFWVMARLLGGLSLTGSGRLLCKDCFIKEWGEPDLRAGHGIPRAGLKSSRSFHCYECGKKL